MALQAVITCHGIDVKRFEQLRDAATAFAEQFAGAGVEVSVDHHCGEGRGECDPGKETEGPRVRVRLTVLGNETLGSAAPKLGILLERLGLSNKPGTILIISALDAEVCPDCGEGVKPGELASHLGCHRCGCRVEGLAA